MNISPEKGKISSFVYQYHDSMIHYTGSNFQPCDPVNYTCSLVFIFHLYADLFFANLLITQESEVLSIIQGL